MNESNNNLKPEDVEIELRKQGCVCCIEDTMQADDKTDLPDTKILIVQEYILGFREDDKTTGAAITLSGFGSANYSIKNKCWLPTPENEIRTIDNQKPNYYTGYKTFTHKGVVYHPYSIATIAVKNIGDIISVLKGLRKHQLPAR